MRLFTLLVACALTLMAPHGAAQARPGCELRWLRLQAHVAYAAVPVRCGVQPAEQVKVRDDRLHLVRVDPRKVTLRALMASAEKGQALTAAGWARARRLSVVVNLGMYRADHLTHVGHLRSGAHTNSRPWVTDYQSLLVLGPRRADLPPARILDRDDPATPGLLGRYDTVVQNLRLVRAARGGQGGEGVWSRQARRWSEAALAMDRQGRLLFVFTRVPLTMWELGRLLLSLPVGIVRAMHLEGGPEASLSVHAGGLDLDLCGSFETGFMPDDSNTKQWPLPNVLAVERR